MKRPEKTEYAEFYAGYVSLVTETDIIAALTEQVDVLSSLVSTISEEKGLYRYAEGKWTIKELLGHLNDGERVFAYRALRFGRGDSSPLSGFDENPYVDASNFNERTLDELIDEFSLLRRANLYIFRNLKPTDWDIVGVASGYDVTVRALAYIMVGHARHHTKILCERYLT